MHPGQGAGAPSSAAAWRGSRDRGRASCRPDGDDRSEAVLGELTAISSRALDEYHGEVVAALREIGNPGFGANIAKDRGSSLEHLGIRFPVLRKRVKAGFSFYDLPEDEILAI